MHNNQLSHSYNKPLETDGLSAALEDNETYSWKV